MPRKTCKHDRHTSTTVGSFDSATFSRASRLLCPICIVLGGLAGAPAPALSQTGSDTLSASETIGEPIDYSVEFELLGDSDLENALKESSVLWQERDRPASGSGGLLAKARGDYRRLLAALYAHARFGGVIHITINGAEAADLPPVSTIAKPARLVVSIDPGPAFVFSQAQIVNEAPPPQDRHDDVKSPASAGFAAGEPARSGAVLQAEKLAVEAWRQQGHAKAEAAGREVIADHATNSVAATIRLNPGPLAYYAPVAVRGTHQLDPDFIAFMADLPAGRQYDPDDLERANTRLGRLGVFKSMRFEEGEAINPDGTLPITMFVQERLPRRFGLGGSFSTIDGPGVEGYWLHRNLFGRAEQLRFDLRVGGFTDTLDPTGLDYRFATTFTRPGVLTPDTNLVASAVAEREVLEAYTKQGLSAQIGYTQVFRKELSGQVMLNGGHANFDDEVFGERSFAHVGIMTGLTWDSRDSQYDPTRGFYAEAIFDPFYEFNYGNAVARMTAEGRSYTSLDPDNKLVFASRLKFGSLIGSTIPETAPDKLFFAGGGGSVRGYAYRNIGVSGPGGETIGGRSLVEGSVELRARLSDTIGLAVFADAGYVDENSLPGLSGDMSMSVGAGLRYFTGFAPIRLDVAVPVNPRSGDPDFAFYIGLGQAF